MYRRIHEKNITSMDYRGLSLARLFSLVGQEWKGGENDIATPHLLETYRMHGMVEPKNGLCA